MSYKLNYVLRTDRPDKAGKCAVRLKVTFNGIRTYKGTDFKVKPEFWDDSLEMFKHEMPNSNQMNYKLNEIKNDFLGEMMNVERLTGSINEAKMGRILAKKDIFDFHEYAESYFKTFKHKYDKETLRGYTSDLNKLKEFRPILTLQDINPDMLAKYHAFLINVRGNSANTCNKCLKPLKVVLRYARDVEKLITEDPFKVYNISKVQTMPIYLEEKELNKLWDILIANPKPVHHSIRSTGLYFLLSCYTGLRYSDLSQVRNSGIIRDNMICLTMVKGHEPLRVPLLKRAVTLLDLIGDTKIVNNQRGNAYLKELQEIAEFTKSLHWHAGRHTFAMLLANMGFDKEIVSVLLGHRDVKTTSTYYKISTFRATTDIKSIQKKLDELGHN